MVARKESTMGEEPTQPYQYDRQVELSEAYKRKVEQLEKQGAFQNPKKPTRMSKAIDLVIRVAVVLIVAGLIIATAAVCLSALP